MCRRVPSRRIKEMGTGSCFLVNSTAANLVLEILNPHSSHQLHTLNKELWHSWFKRVISEPHSQKQKSSTYNAAGEVIRSGRSYIINEKSMGLRTLPWGVPFSRRLVKDNVDPSLTWKVRFDRNEWINLNMRLEIPYLRSLERGTSSFTISQAFSRSINTDKTLCLFPSDFWIASWRLRMWSVVFRHCRKPDCEILRILWYSKNQLSRHTTIFSEFAHFAGQGYWPLGGQ